MKNTKKRGFTLIELLAVIVILAIIALIATPIVLNMISSARESAAKSSALGYIEAIEYNNGFAELGTDANLPETYTKVTSGDISSINIKSKGKKPESGTVTINSEGKVTGATLCVNGYTVTYNGKEVTDVSKGCSGSSASAQTYPSYSIGQSINYNPVTNEACTIPTSTTETKTGCMKWYVIASSGTNDSTVDVILDHNTTTSVAWVSQADYNDDTNWSSNKNSKGPITANAQITIDTTNWVSGLEPRLITADEIAVITGNDGWSSATKTSSYWFCFDTNESDNTNWCAKSQGTSSYKWLFDYTAGCTSYGCDIEDSSVCGYWTSSPEYNNSNRAWIVTRNGRLDISSVNNSGYYCGSYGIRPVITISKSDLS